MRTRAHTHTHTHTHTPIMLDPVPSILRSNLLGGSETLYFKQRNEFGNAESCSSGCCSDFLACKVFDNIGQFFSD